jgi:hypothetical protein
MTEKNEIRFEALFLHDTQMADLALEQRTLRSVFHRIAFDSPLPFSPLPPFCPIICATSAADSASRVSTPVEARVDTPPPRLGIGALTVRNGWIIRPLIAPVSGMPTYSAVAVPSLPGYPPFPAEPGFILGYAGDFSDRLLAEASFPEAFTVSARYRSTLTVTVETAEGSENPNTYCASYTISAVRWEKGEN